MFVDIVAIRKLKRPVGFGVWSAYVLGVDEYGTWLHTPPGSSYCGHDGERTDVCALAQDSSGAGRPVVQLIAPGAWWIATWYPVSEGFVVTVDICTPAVLAARTWTYVDLELDPWRSVDGGVPTDDWDEFRAPARSARSASTKQSRRSQPPPRSRTSCGWASSHSDVKGRRGSLPPRKWLCRRCSANLRKASL